MSNPDQSEKATIFVPSGTEQKLLDVLLNPENRFKSITEVCELAGTSRKAYYRAFARQDFADYYREECEALVRRSIGPVVNACVREAIAGSASHAKMVLGMAGMYAEKQDLRILDKNGVPQNVGGLANMTDKEIEDELKRYDAIREATQA